MKRYPASYFTMIELLIVIAIIMILAGLLLPALRRAKMTSHEASCKSNLKQLYLAWFNYADDHNQVAPLYYDSSSGDIWVSALFSNRYVQQPGWGEMVENCKKGGVLICPSYAYDTNAVKAHVLYKYIAYTYAVYPLPGGNNWKRIKYTSQTLLFCDTGDANSLYYRVDSSSLISKNDPPILSNRHSGKLNLVFCDGHTESYKGTMPIPLPAVGTEWPWFKTQL